MEKMKAMVIEQFGESDVFVEKEIDIPILKENEILVKARSGGGAIQSCASSGYAAYDLSSHPQLPMIHFVTYL